MKEKFFYGAGVLGICGIIAKVIGAFYRIPLTNILGAEGMGLYQMIFPLYTTLLAISSGGFPVALSRAVSVRGDRDAKDVLRVALISLSLVSAAAGAFIAIFSGAIARLQGNAAAKIGYIAIAPSLVFVAIISCFRGYFQGKMHMTPSAVSQIIEQVIKLVFGLALAKILLPRGVAMAALGSIIGVTISEFVAALSLTVHYLLTRNSIKKLDANANIAVNTAVNTDASFLLEAAQDCSPEVIYPQNIAETRKKRRQNTRKILAEIYKMAIPVTIGSLVLPLTQVLDSFLVINILSRVIGEASATSMYGLVGGAVNTLLNLPSVLSVALAGALLPQLARAFAAHKAAQNLTKKAIIISVIIGVVSFLALFFGAKIAMKILYSRGLSASELETATTLLRVGAIAALYVSVLTVATAALQAMNKSRIPVRNLSVGALVKIVLTVLLLPVLGIAGAVIATAACYSLTCLLDVISLRRALVLRQDEG